MQALINHHRNNIIDANTPSHSSTLFAHPILRLLAACVLSTVCVIANAKSVYISDKVYVPVRKGAGGKFSILHKGLPSGTQVTLIERGEKWSKIQTTGGIIGWIPNQYASSTPTASILLESAKQKAERLQKQNQDLKQKLKEQQTTLTDTKDQLKQANQLSDTMTSELNEIKAVSSSALETRNRLQSITQKLQRLQTENDVLRSENDTLQTSERTSFFIYGALAVLIGAIIALLVPRLQFKRRNSQWIN